jgi:hypothetical protein
MVRLAVKAQVNLARRREREAFLQKLADTEHGIQVEKAKLEEYQRELAITGAQNATVSTDNALRREPVTPPSGQHVLSQPSPDSRTQRFEQQAQNRGEMLLSPPTGGMQESGEGVSVSASDVDVICQMLIDDLLVVEPELDRLMELSAPRYEARSPKNRHAAAWDDTAPPSSPDKQSSPVHGWRSRTPSPDHDASASADDIGTDQRDVLALGGRIVGCFIKQGCTASLLPMKWADVDNAVTLPRDRTTDEHRMHNRLVFDCVNEILSQMYALCPASCSYLSTVMALCC